MSTPPENAIARINARVVRCRACPRLVEHREEIGRVKRRAYRNKEYWARPVPGFGDARARLIVVGLAPAAHGANRTGRMFTGDRSGQWLYRALHRAGFANQPESLARDDGLRLRAAYITAVARCAPPDNKPTPEELQRCRPYLVDELRHFCQGARRSDPMVIVALGHIAFRATLDTLVPIGIVVGPPQPRFGHAVEYRLDDRLTLLGSYHPSQQNTQTGRLTEPMLDAVFALARKLLG